MFVRRDTTADGVNDSKGHTVLGVAWGLASFCTILMILRVFTRLRVSALGTPALCWALFAWIWTFVGVIFATFAVKYGLGKHLDDVEAEGNTSKFLLWSWLLMFIFNVAMPLGKVAAASFLLALHAQTHAKRRYLIHFIGWSNIILAIPNWVLFWIHCGPDASAMWDPTRQADCHVGTSLKYTMFLGGWAALSDFVLAFIPTALIWPLMMDAKVKFALCVLMGIGVVAGALTIVRTVLVLRLFDADISYNLADLVVWAEAEKWLVLISTSIPPIYPLFRPWLEKTFSSKSTSTKPRLEGGTRLKHVSLAVDHRRYSQIDDADVKGAMPQYFSRVESVERAEDGETHGRGPSSASGADS
ncbi:MAG: hypothetical protein M1828_005652 [Chrysothrix sp. TS-e1954]|nr:MAG: hypothetical protein M1828_005652 [Chrysothrix sp. TS-e1954]